MFLWPTMMQILQWILRTTSLVLVLLNNALVSWGSRKQPSCSSSTIEVEYIFVASIEKEIIRLHWILDNLGLPSASPTMWFADNQSAIHLVRNPKYYRRMKDIDV